MLKHIGRSKNARAWYLHFNQLRPAVGKIKIYRLSSIISLTIVLITPIFPIGVSPAFVLIRVFKPFNAPPKQRKIIACPNEVENPNPTLEITALSQYSHIPIHDNRGNSRVPNSPVIMTPFRPPQSESATLPHNIAGAMIRLNMVNETLHLPTTYR
jgi:hypothetical protein